MTRWMIFIGRVLLGLVLVYAAYTKLFVLEVSPFRLALQPWISFAAQIQAYKLSWLSDDAVIFIAKTLPWGELVLGVLLLIGVQLRWVATAASLLMVFFFAALVRSYALGMNIDCGCFGTGDRLTWKTLVREGVLLAVALSVACGAFLTRRKAGAVPAMTQEPQAADGRTK